MHRNPAFFLFILALVFLFLSFSPKQSFAQNRLYQCSPAIGYPASVANCNSGPARDCPNPAENCASGVAQTGKQCAEWSAICYSTPGKTLTTQCIDKCTDTPLKNICSPDANNLCPDANFTCQGSEGQPVRSARDKTYCIQYTQVLPSPTPTPPPVPPCVQSGGSCTRTYPCNPGYQSSGLSCGVGGGVCCQVPAPTATPTPTPTPISLARRPLARLSEARLYSGILLL